MPFFYVFDQLADQMNRFVEKSDWFRLKEKSFRKLSALSLRLVVSTTNYDVVARRIYPVNEESGDGKFQVDEFMPEQGCDWYVIDGANGFRRSMEKRVKNCRG